MGGPESAAEAWPSAQAPTTPATQSSPPMRPASRQVGLALTKSLPLIRLQVQSSAKAQRPSANRIALPRRASGPEGTKRQAMLASLD